MIHSHSLVHSTHIYLPMKMEQTECSETSAYKHQTPGNYPKESIQCTCIAHPSVRILKLDYYRYGMGTSLNRLFLQQGIEISYGNFPKTITGYSLDAV
jgi:hypothetical protein